MTTPLSSYQIMWMQVIFDIPVKTKPERKAATTFRKTLLNLGFHMVQYSVYMKYVTNKKKQAILIAKIKSHLPSKGSVYVLSITDKQYENIYAFIGKNKSPSPKNPEQLTLF